MFGGWGRQRSSTRRSSARRSAGRRASQRVPGVEVRLERAEHLPSADSNGFSDPYCVFAVGKLSKHKSGVVRKSLNPAWEETFFLAAPENTETPLHIQVMDHDFVGKDDFLGEVSLDISELSNDGAVTKFELDLKGADGEPAGCVFFSLKRTTKRLDDVAQNKRDVQKWAVPTGDRRIIVEAIEGMDLLPMDSNGLSDPYLTLKLGKIKHTSRVCPTTLSPHWKQRFEFLLKAGDSPKLSIRCYDRDRLSRNDFMGSLAINIDDLQPKIVNEGWHDLKLDGRPAGHVHLLVTVIDTDRDLVLTKEQREDMVGSVKCHVVQARGLSSADYFSKTSDPYVELQVGNARLRTATITKTLDPFWDQLLELPVRDIFSCLELSVWDQDSRGRSKPDFLGKIIVPLLEIKNNDTNWYALKSADGLRRGQGDLQVAFNFSYKIPAAYGAAIKRRELNYMERRGPFSVRRLINAVNRLNDANAWIIDGFAVIGDLLNWRLHPAYSVLACIAWILICIFFRPWQIPLALVITMLCSRIFSYRRRTTIKIDEKGLLVTRHNKADTTGLNELGIADDINDDALFEDDSDSENESDEEKENMIEGSAPKSIVKKKKKGKDRAGVLAQIRVLRKIGKSIQDKLEFAATVQERFANLFLNWSVPLLTQLTTLAMLAATVVMFFIPWNILAMLFGVWQFIKRGLRKFVWPRSKFHVPINEAIEFLGRIPSNMDLAKRTQLTPRRHSTVQNSKTSAKLASFEERD